MIRRASIKIESFEQLQDLVDTYGIENLECHGTPYFGGARFGFNCLGSLIKTTNGYSYESRGEKLHPDRNPLTYWGKDGMAIKDLHIKPLIESTERAALEMSVQMDLFGGI